MSINLAKGQKIDLRKKSGDALTNFCVGVNWGMIQKKGFFGTKKVAVDLDASCALFDENNNLLDVVYFGQLKSKDGSINHSGDDLVGDTDGDDGLDNEIISVNLSRIPQNVDQVVFFLNSFKGQDFETVPFAAIRLYEGTPTRVNNIVATYDIATDSSFRGYVSMVMGKLYKRNNEWKFSAIGEPTADRELKGTLATIINKYI
ncbi:TerD family protein [Winogradskyella wichelsiae]|uniref:TerD family protein n=1 Tax=Winogradskyella wichelsiae TaxID=2697007 RepID=UPI0015C85ED7|nr:TerD family protein [Winogradskyella wichelsiae]